MSQVYNSPLKGGEGLRSISFPLVGEEPAPGSTLGVREADGLGVREADGRGGNAFLPHP
jgi:hypothetical protein